MQLRWYQEEAIDALFAYFNDPIRAHSLQPANPLVCLPTGTGKSVVIAEFIRRSLMLYNFTRVMMLTHVKELIEQNAKKLLEVWPQAPLGIYSAGLNSREHMQQIVFGGVQSCVGKFPLFGLRHLAVVDEAHLISPSADTSYLKLFKELKEGGEGCDINSGNVNPWLKIIGLTATPYRLGLGCMTNGGIFTDIVYNLCTIEGFNRLIAEGFLCPLIPKKTKTELDVSNVSMNAGEFAQGQLQAAVDKNDVTYAALQEVVESGYNRRSWLVFASGVEHAEHIAEMLNTAFGISTVCIHSKKSKTQNEASLEAWKTGRVRAAVNMNSLTTGIDHPACDLIAMMRPTMSTGLWVQMLGRGTRPFPGKENCLVLDFAGNTRRLGPINDPVIPRRKGEGAPGDAPVKTCKACGTYNHASARFCVVCGEEFIFEEKLSRKASELELLRSNLPQIETFNVDRVVLVEHDSKAGNNTIKIAYYCGLRTFFEYKSVESNIPFIKKKSRDWFRRAYHYRYGNLPGWDNDVPTTNKEVLALVHELRHPKQIKVWVNRQMPEIQEYVY